MYTIVCDGMVIARINISGLKIYPGDSFAIGSRHYKVNMISFPDNKGSIVIVQVIQINNCEEPQLNLPFEL